MKTPEPKQITDRRTEFHARRVMDADNYILMALDPILNEALEKIEALLIKRGPDLPSKTHVQLAEAARKRILKRLQQARYP